MLVNYEEQNTILACEQEPKDKLILQAEEKGKVRVKMLNLLSGAAPVYQEGFVVVDLDVLELAIKELKEMQ
ncbi:hypothetical protein VPHD249_0046 [Vibrio phage D249]|nr:hypothetical protein SIPHO036v1_140008 [Vibrio phage 70E38.1]QZI87959.1 hypothetical protein SIPHO041v1_p0048 [Vibrio phage 234P1]QZI88129.1 hypothetical protein SIPHO035v1_p0038 [Vibrio phage 234P7B]QZI88403.1 hypothetical protein SIPHO082v1_p0126 [Vibrio phage 294E48.1]QZI88497.1 hypothetical protein SIPHO037v1_p0056 [Vibrio phage 70E35.2]QZI88681.1 hypothetical protein SIPHO039v1_p0052 [Vibrio phage 70E35.5a]QZI88866.1 hypothetical protein SIPHO040v1_p0053 [Vibrio phage 70E35.6]QZI8915